MRSNHCAFAVVLLSVAAALAPAAPPNIYNLGTLGGPSSNAFAINNAGQVTGLSEAAGALRHAFLYTGTPGVDGMMHDLGTLGGTYSTGYGINDSGQIVGWSWTAADAASHAFLYTGTPGSGGMMNDLGTLGGISSQGINSWAFGVNDSGQIVGKSTTLPNFHEHAFLYSGTPGAGGMMHDLGIYGSANDINEGGQIVGVGETAGGFNRAFLYAGTPGIDGDMYDLGSVNAYDVGSEGRAINNRGQVTGTFYVWADEQQPNIPRAFLYTGTPGVDGMMHDLGIDGFADDINNRGQVVGSECAFNSFPCEIGHAFVYTGTPGVDGQKIDLDAWLDVNNPVEGAKWTLSRGLGINDNGLITGDGHYDDGPGGLSDGYRAFLLDASSLLLPDLPGDFNFDGSVDAADYVAWRKSPNNFGGDPAGYNAWRAHFGRTSGSELAASENPVPEPGSLVLLTLAAPALLRHRQVPQTGRVRPLK
jgi:probable HAF family extracellular repeat protein